MLKTLLLRNFRNYTEQKIHFSPKKNFILGQNGQGKTNLIEAICLVTTGRSHRTFDLTECIQHTKTFFYLEAAFEENGQEETIKLYFEKNKKNLSINKNTHSSFSPLIGLHPAVIHTPYDLNLIAGAPSFRRKLFDLHLSQLDKSYLLELIWYMQAKKQRDHLLKHKISQSIECFEEQMDKYGKKVIEKRKKMIEDALPLFSYFTQKFLPEKNSSIDYFPSTENIIESLEKNRTREFISGATTKGPHRDDFSFLLNDKPARFFASEGQKRACILALRLSEYKRLQELCRPLVFCIDDMATHFDPERQNSLKELLTELDQVFITLPDPNCESFGPENTLLVQNGSIS